MGLESILGKVLGRASGAAKGFAEGATSALGNVVAKGGRSIGGGVARSLWGSTTEVGRYAVQGPGFQMGLIGTARRNAIPGVLREAFPSFKNKTLGYGAKFGAAAGIDAYLETPDAQGLSGAGEFGLRAVGFGLRFGAYRSLARGVAGTVLGGAGRATGDPMAFYGAYQKAAKGLGAFWKSGSLTNMALRGAAWAGREAAYTPLRGVMGIGSSIRSTMGVASRLTADMPVIGAGAGRFANWLGASSMSAALNPRAGPVSRGINKVLPGFLNKDLDAPIVSSMFLMGAAGGALSARSQQNRKNRNWIGGPNYNPANYGAGISAMRRGGAQNYGPALTLMLHGNHRRVMP